MILRVLPALALLAGLTACAAAPPAALVYPPPAADITLAFAGDVHFIERTGKLLTDPAQAFGPITSVLADADLTMLNVESAITARGTPQTKRFHFRTRPAALDALRAAGVDVATFANNHVLDYGQVGLADTLAAARAARFPYVGIGTDADAAWAPYLTTIKGRRFAFLGVSQVDELAASWVATPARPGEAHALDLARTLAAVAAAKKRADTVVVFMHWGTEGNRCPNAAQKSLAPKLAAAGADIVIGAHAHTLQGSGWLGHTFVAYGMGNFLWWLPSYSTETGVLKLTLHPDGTLTDRFYPAVVSDTGRPLSAAGIPLRGSRPGTAVCVPAPASPPRRRDTTRGVSGLARGAALG